MISTKGSDLMQALEAPLNAPVRAGKALLYIEPEHDGHHLAVYGAAIWERFIAEGWTVFWLTSFHAARSEVAAGLIGRFGSRLVVHAHPFLRLPSSGGRPLEWLRYQAHHRRLLNGVVPQISAAVRLDCIFMPWLDYCDRACGMFGLPRVGVPIVALHMHVSLHEPIPRRSSWMRKASRRITEKSTERLYAQTGLRKVAVIVESFANFARDSRMPGWEKIVYVPDAGSLGVLPSRDESRASYSLGEKDVAILCFGALTARKGVHLLLRGANEADTPETIVLILAGKQDREVQETIATLNPTNGRKPVRIIDRNTFVDPDEERRLFAASDIVWVGYPGFLGSSGVLIQAGCASLPVIAGIQGEIGTVVRTTQSGITCDLSDPSLIAAAIRTLSADGELRAFMGKNGASNSERHNPRIFAGNILRIIEEAVGARAPAR